MSAKDDFKWALSMLGEATIRYAQTKERSDLDNMVYWQNQLWAAAQAVVAEGE